MNSAGSDDGCIFCDRLADGQGVLLRRDRTFVLLNAFPYNSGHLMVAPQRHVGDPAALEGAESHELIDVSFLAVEVLRRAMHPHGFNMGINLGQVAGAGVPGHLHVHVVPRWGGDTNFMPVVGETKVLPELLADTESKLRPPFEETSKLDDSR